MSTLELSNDFANEAATRMFANVSTGRDPLDDTGAVVSPYYGGYPNTTLMALLTSWVMSHHGTTLCLMSGDIPSVSSIDNMVIADYLPQVLWSCSSAIGGVGNDALVFNISNVSSNPVTINTNYYNAAETGISNWFWMYGTFYNPWLGTPYPTAIHSVIGTVGGPGSGCDLVLSDNTIIAGKPYCVRNLQIQFPSYWGF